MNNETDNSDKLDTLLNTKFSRFLKKKFNIILDPLSFKYNLLVFVFWLLIGALLAEITTRILQPIGVLP